MAMTEIDFPKLMATLKEKLPVLKGVDFEAVDREERLAGNAAVNVTMTPSFQIRLAARAIDVNPHDLKALPLKQYNRINLEVTRFLFADLETEETLSKSFETLPPSSENTGA